MRLRAPTCLWVLVLIGGSRVLGAEAPKLPRFLEADQVFAYAELASPEVVLDRIQSDRIIELLKAVPGLEKALQNEQARQVHQVVTVVAESLGTTPEQAVRKLLGGGIAVAVVGRQQKPDQLLVAIKSKDPAFLERAHQKLVELAREDAKSHNRPDPVKQAEYKGVQGFSVHKDEAHAILDGTLWIANGPEPLKALIDRIQEPKQLEKPLASDTTWSQQRNALSPDTTAWAYARLDRLREADPKRYAPDRINPGALFLFGPWAEAARHGDWVSLDLSWTERKLALNLTLPRPEKGYSESLSGFLPRSGQGASAPLKVPGVIASGTLWRDLASIWEERGSIFPAEQQQGFAQLDTFAGQFFGGRDFGSGVLGAIGQRWNVVVARQDPQTLQPRPDLILPAFAVVIDLKDEDPEFAQRLKAAFQSFVGLTNLGAAQTKAPPLMLGSEEFEGVPISSARFLPPSGSKEEPVHQRHNFSPSVAQVGQSFVIGSSVSLTKDLIKALKSPAQPGPATLLLEAQGAELARLIDQNQDRLVMNNMVEKGNDRNQAESEIALLRKLVNYFGHGTLTAVDTNDGARFSLQFDLGQ